MPWSRGVDYCWGRAYHAFARGRVDSGLERKDSSMKIIHTRVFAGDQDKALKFYTETLGFVKKSDITRGRYRWLTVVSPDDQNGPELVLESNDNPAAKTYQKAIFEQNIPAANFGVSDVRAEHDRLKGLGVRFTMEPTKVMEHVTIAVFDDTCGNLIQIQQTAQK
jgi:catechol 2,3-dioxygenase-like lactoylglutathione lyase family enzyme